MGCKMLNLHKLRISVFFIKKTRTMQFAFSSPPAVVTTEWSACNESPDGISGRPLCWVQRFIFFHIHFCKKGLQKLHDHPTPIASKISKK